jgi:hypothetical protein
MLTLADEVQSLFHRGRESYRIDSQHICTDVKFAFSPLLWWGKFSVAKRELAAKEKSL